MCTALQLTNFWQDLGVDWSRGRLYVPLEDRDRAGARDADLDAARMTPEWQAALRAVAARTRALFDAGRPVCDAVRGRLRWELRFTWLGASVATNTASTRSSFTSSSIDGYVFAHRAACASPAHRSGIRSLTATTSTFGWS